MEIENNNKEQASTKDDITRQENSVAALVRTKMKAELSYDIHMIFMFVAVLLPVNVRVCVCVLCFGYV